MTFSAFPDAFCSSYELWRTVMVMDGGDTVNDNIKTLPENTDPVGRRNINFSFLLSCGYCWDREDRNWFLKYCRIVFIFWNKIFKTKAFLTILRWFYHLKSRPCIVIIKVPQMKVKHHLLLLQLSILQQHYIDSILHVAPNSFVSASSSST